MTERDEHAGAAPDPGASDEATEPAGAGADEGPAPAEAAPVGDADAGDSEASEAAEDQAGDDRDRVEAERDELRATLQRVQADFENFRKRIMRDQALHAERAHEGLVEQLLPVLDSFELAVLNVPADELSEAGEKLKKGVELVYAELIGVLEKAGLARIDAHGAAFDPEEHEAVMRDEGDGPPAVTEVLRTGYRLKGRVLRPAMVRVGPAQAAPDDPAAEARGPEPDEEPWEPKDG